MSLNYNHHKLIKFINDFIRPFISCQRAFNIWEFVGIFSADSGSPRSREGPHGEWGLKHLLMKFKKEGKKWRLAKPRGSAVVWR